MAQRNQTAFLHYPTQFAQTPQSLQTTSRNFVLIPSPNPAVYHNRKPFMEKIDYSKIQLRKTEQLDGIVPNIFTLTNNFLIFFFF